MSALFTALVESESKEILAESLLEHREVLRRAYHLLKDLKRGEVVSPDLALKAFEVSLDAGTVLDTFGFHDAGPSRVTVTRPSSQKSPPVREGSGPGF